MNEYMKLKREGQMEDINLVVNTTSIWYDPGSLGSTTLRIMKEADKGRVA